MPTNISDIDLDQWDPSKNPLRVPGMQPGGGNQDDLMKWLAAQNPQIPAKGPMPGPALQQSSFMRNLLGDQVYNQATAPPSGPAVPTARVPVEAAAGAPGSMEWLQNLPNKKGPAVPLNTVNPYLKAMDRMPNEDEAAYRARIGNIQVNQSGQPTGFDTPLMQQLALQEIQNRGPKKEPLITNEEAMRASLQKVLQENVRQPSPLETMPMLAQLRGTQFSRRPSVESYMAAQAAMPAYRVEEAKREAARQAAMESMRQLGPMANLQMERERTEALKNPQVALMAGKMKMYEKLFEGAQGDASKINKIMRNMAADIGGGNPFQPGGVPGGPPTPLGAGGQFGGLGKPTPLGEQTAAEKMDKLDAELTAKGKDFVKNGDPYDLFKYAYDKHGEKWVKEHFPLLNEFTMDLWSTAKGGARANIESAARGSIWERPVGLLSSIGNLLPPALGGRGKWTSATAPVYQGPASVLYRKLHGYTDY